MTLSEYLDAAGLKPAQFAQELGVEPSTITRMLSGARGPSLEMALRIEAATTGQVTPKDWARDGVPPTDTKQVAA